MAFEQYVRSGQKLLRLGYTTGTCAALAAAGATQLLLTGAIDNQLSVMTGRGIEVTVEPEDCHIDGAAAWCAVTKDGGDDIDVTTGIRVYAEVIKTDVPGICIDGGKGVGRVTKPGLDQPPGNAAINSGPRRMIDESVQAICDKVGYKRGLLIRVHVPEGEEKSKKTFNPQLGIVGGISILGTTGIVEPMSNEALISTIEIEINQAAIESKKIILVPGNYGMDFLEREGLSELGIPIVKISNFFGEALDIVSSKGFEEVLVVAHAGKLVKLAAGIMVTHSKYADGRKEVMVAHAAINGADTDTSRRLMDAASTDACIEILEEAGLTDAVMSGIMNEVQRNIDRRTQGKCFSGALMFSNVYGRLGQTENGIELEDRWTREIVPKGE